MWTPTAKNSGSCLGILGNYSKNLNSSKSTENGKCIADNHIPNRDQRNQIGGSVGKRNRLAHPKTYGGAVSNNFAKHHHALKNIFEEGELEEAATCKDFLQVGKEGERMVKRSQRSICSKWSQSEKEGGKWGKVQKGYSHKKRNPIV